MATLTEMLYFDDINLNDAEVAVIKRALGNWLREVNLPNHASIDKMGTLFNSTESIRQLLITLVDEP